MKKKVTISTIGAVSLAVPMDCRPQDIVDQTKAYWQKKIDRVLPEKPDLIVLPELCDNPRGFSASQLKDYYQVRKDQVQQCLAEVARRNRCYLIYPAARQIEDGSWRNSAVVLDRQGRVAGIYDKNYAVIDETTEHGILCGTEALIVDCDFGRLGCAICFDLNFDELRLRYAAAKADLIVHPSLSHGGILQAYWAYSCRCYFVSAVGLESIRSEIRDPHGQVIASTSEHYDFVTATVNLDFELAHLDGNWEKLRALKEKYGRGVEIHEPGAFGSVRISSATEGISTRQMIDEFSIELLDDYLARSRRHHDTAQ